MGQACSCLRSPPRQTSHPREDVTGGVSDTQTCSLKGQQPAESTVAGKWQMSGAAAGGETDSRVQEPKKDGAIQSQCSPPDQKVDDETREVLVDMVFKPVDDWPSQGPDGEPCDELPLSNQPWDLHTDYCPYPPCDEQRRQTGTALGLHDAAARCPELDQIMRTVCAVFEAPYSITALYYNRCCWIASSHNWGLGHLNWKLVACPWNTLYNQPHSIVCGELQEDARFHHQPWVDQGLRCYVSAPLLTSNGHRLGTVCFMDTVPRKIDAGMCRVLNNFGELAVRVLERHLQLADRLATIRHALPRSLTSFVDAAHTGRDIRDAAGGGGRAALSGIDEGLWEQEPEAAAAAKELKPADLLLADAFARQLRNVEGLLDACCLVVDTGSPGWSVVYADDTWKLWAGYSRNDILTKPLQSLLAPASPGMAPLNWAAWQRQVEAAERFVIPGVTILSPQGHAPQTTMNNTIENNGQNDAYLRKGSPSDHETAWLSTSIPHDLEMRPSASQCASPRQTVKAGTPAAQGAGKAAQGAAAAAAPVCGDETHSVFHTAASTHTAAAAPTSVFSGRNTHSVGHSVNNGSYGDLGESTEDLIESMALHDAKKRTSVATQSAAASASGVEWHEAAGAAAAHVSAGDVLSCAHAAPTTVGCNALSGPMTSTGRGSNGKVLNLSFRPMALDVLDGDALPLGFPSWVPMEACPPMLRLYAVRIHAVTAQHLPPQPLTPTLKVTNATGGGLHSLAGQLFPGLQIGQVLGRGGYGTAYTGTWHDATVVVKVQDHNLANEEALRTAQVEVALGQLLRHPHLVRTLAHGSAEVTHNNPHMAPSTAGSTTPPTTHMQPSGAGVAPPTQTGVAMQSNTYKSLSALSMMAEQQEWDEYGGRSWFSHCADEDCIRRMLIDTEKVQTLTSRLPDISEFINHVAVAADTQACPPPPPQPAGLAGFAKAPDPQPLISLSEHGPNAQVVQFLLPKRSGSDAMGEELCQRSQGARVPPPAGATPSSGSCNTLNSHEARNLLEVVYKPFFRAATRGLTAQAGKGAENASPQRRGGEAAERVAQPLPAADAADAGQPSALVSGSRGSVGYSAEVQMATMLESGRQHADRVGAKPMQFPMQLRTFAILEYCDAGSLQEAIDRGWLRKGLCHIDSPPNLPKILTLASHIASAVTYLHESGVVHADLSSANVLLCSAKPLVSRAVGVAIAADSAAEITASSNATNDMGAPMVDTGLCVLPTKRYTLAPSRPRTADDMQFVAKVADFGKSCLLGPEGVTKAGGYATLTHMAPEVLTDQTLSPAADVYAVGVLLWQMFTGSRPWAGLNHRQIIAAVVSGAAQLEWPEEHITRVPQDQQPAARRLAELGRACCAFNPRARPTMFQVEGAIQTIIHELPHPRTEA